MKSNHPTDMIDDQDVSQRLENTMKSNHPTDMIDENDLSNIDPATISLIAIVLFIIPLILTGFFFQ